MAEATLFCIAQSVLQQLTTSALDELYLLWGYKAQLEKLENTITTIKDVLQDAERREDNTFAIRGWLSRVRAALYEADDFLDSISARVLHEKAKGRSKRRPYHFAFSVKSAHKVKAIRENFDAIARDINQFSFLLPQTDQGQSRRIRREQSHSYIPSNEVVGRDQETEDIVKMLLPESFQEQSVSVVVIIGVGGLGKTTLAQLVYNDERVEQGFDLRLWVCVNYLSHLEEVLAAILKSATNSSPKGLDIDQMQSLLREKIQGKRFLLVLDDVWEEDSQNWRKLKILLSFGKAGSMVLATTRSVIVAHSSLANKPYYYLQVMSDESAWSLFEKIAFGKEGNTYGQDLKLLGKEIVNKCANVPLTIVIIASLLRHKEKNRWASLLNDELSKVVPNEYQKVTQTIKISYNQLSHPLKRCFAYCSLFPKGSVIKKHKLVRLWIAQGFVEPCGVGQSLEDAAEEYFFYLVERCFFKYMHSKMVNGVTIYSCQMHDLVHDLAVEVVGSETAIVNQTAHSPWHKTLRHVSLICESESLVHSICSFPHSNRLRTLLLLNKIPLGTNTLNKLVWGSKALRVLDLSEIKIKKIPESIGELVHLRLLDLSYNYEIEKLPSSVCSLYHLQSLILRGCGCLKELPGDIGNLLSLRCLELNYCDQLSQMPPGLAALTSLVTLDRLIVNKTNGGLRYLGSLDNLSGCLKIELPATDWQNAITDVEGSSLSQKEKLNALVIDWRSRTAKGNLLEPDIVMSALQPHHNLEHLKILDFGGKKMPAWIGCLHNLVSLTLSSCRIFTELLPLSHLKYLKELSIRNMSSVVVIDDGVFYDHNSFFPALETLLIWNMPNLISWWTESPLVLPTFPRATKVKIGNCPKLTTGMPLFPLVEDLELSSVQDKIFWQAIGSGETSALNRLNISMIEGLSSLDARIQHLSALQRLEIYRCEQLTLVSCNALAQLTSLEELLITTCEKIEWVDADFDLPRLKFLVIPIINKIFYKGLKYLNSLQELKVSSFKQELEEASIEEEDGMPWKPLHKLRHMELEFGETFSMRNNQHLLKGVEHLTSLQKLTLSHCSELYLSWTSLLTLNHLQILKIDLVKEVINVESTTVQKQQINYSLQELKITASSAEWLHDIPWKAFQSLQSLDLSGIHNLQALPEGIQHLTALQQLRIYGCKTLTSLPMWMSYLSSLRSLQIQSSSEELKNHCERLTGKDWPKIQHIPTISIA